MYPGTWGDSSEAAEVLLDVLNLKTDGIIGIDKALKEYLYSVDEVPHHFHLHLMHAAEILGYKHPDKLTRG